MFRGLPLIYTVVASLESPDIIPYSTIAISLHNTIILILTDFSSFNP